MIADIASVFHWGLTDLMETDCTELVAWHEQAVRIAKDRPAGW